VGGIPGAGAGRGRLGGRLGRGPRRPPPDGVPPYRWAAEAGLGARVRGLRQGLVTDAVGKLAEAATAAVEMLRGLLAEGQPASVRLGAVQAILSALIDVQAHAELSDRVTRLEEWGGAGGVGRCTA